MRFRFALGIIRKKFQFFTHGEAVGGFFSSLLVTGGNVEHC